MKEIVLNDDITLKLARASFVDALALKNMLLRKFKLSGLDFSDLNADSIEGLMEADLDGAMISQLLEIVVNLEADEDLTKQILLCCKKSTINGERISMDAFENVDFWPYLIDLKIETIRYNVLPFFHKLQSSFNRLFSKK